MLKLLRVLLLAPATQALPCAWIYGSEDSTNGNCVYPTWVAWLDTQQICGQVAGQPFGGSQADCEAGTRGVWPMDGAERAGKCEFVTSVEGGVTHSRCFRTVAAPDVNLQKAEFQNAANVASRTCTAHSGADRATCEAAGGSGVDACVWKAGNAEKCNTAGFHLGMECTTADSEAKCLGTGGETAPNSECAWVVAGVSSGPPITTTYMCAHNSFYSSYGDGTWELWTKCGAYHNQEEACKAYDPAPVDATGETGNNGATADGDGCA